MRRFMITLLFGLTSWTAQAKEVITECPYLLPSDPKIRLFLAEMLHLGDAGTVDSGDYEVKIAPKLLYTPHIYGEKGGFEGAVLLCRYGKWEAEIQLRLPVPGKMIRYDIVVYYPGGKAHPIYLRAWATSVVKKPE
ncbi:MAG: hypothetical protein HZC25_12545 [Rhodospirillales bacterium]|nr:hypothetical protein [Rhodospirillales bacterium]